MSPGTARPGAARLVTHTRSNREDLFHYGAYCVVVGGRVVRARGESDSAVYYRSAAKPIQALAVVESGAADRFGFSDEELALVVGSHSGSPRHAALAASMLAKAGEGPKLLRCGGHRPLGRDVEADYIRRGYVPGRLEDNCSGKHAGMIAAAKAFGAEPRTYADRDHPVQRHNLANVARFTGLEPGEIGIGVDGCAVPSFAVPLRAMALAAARYARPGSDLPDGTAEAVARITGVALAHPEMVAGEGRFDTRVMRMGAGKVLSKQGAGGVQILSLLEHGAGIAIKIWDGSGSAVQSVAVTLLREEFGLLTENEAHTLATSLVRTREGDSVGEIRVTL